MHSKALYYRAGTNFHFWLAIWTLTRYFWFHFPIFARQSTHTDTCIMSFMSSQNPIALDLTLLYSTLCGTLTFHKCRYLDSRVAFSNTYSDPHILISPGMYVPNPSVISLLGYST